MVRIYMFSPYNCHWRPDIELYMDIRYIGSEKAEKIVVRLEKPSTHLNMTDQETWL